MNLSLTVTGTPAEITNAVALLNGGGATAKLESVAEEVADTVTKELTTAEKSRITKARKKAEREAAAAKAKEAEAAESDDLGLGDDTPEEPEISLDDLKGAVRTFIEANSVDAVKAIFKAHKAAKISDIAVENYAVVFAKLGGAK